MIPQSYNLPDAYRGDTMPEVSFQVAENSVYVDLTGSTITMQLRNGGKVAKEFSSTLGNISIVSAASGQFKILPVTLDIPAGIYDYDIEVFLATGYKNTYVKGTLNVIQDVTY